MMKASSDVAGASSALAQQGESRAAGVARARKEGRGRVTAPIASAAAETWL